MRKIDADKIDCAKLEAVYMSQAQEYIDSQPTVDDTIYAHWEPVSKKYNCGYRCSHCKKAKISNKEYNSTIKRNYCFYCGAKMIKESE